MVSWKKMIAALVVVAVLGFGAGWLVEPTVSAQGSSNSSFRASLPLFQEVYNTLLKDYVTRPSSSTLLEGAINGLTGSLNDPYTVYYTPAQYQQFLNQLNGNLGIAGIGVEINQVGQFIVIEAVLPGSPAAKAGLEAGDEILDVNGKSLVGATADQAATLIRGKQGTQVTITVERGTRSFPLTLTREPLSLPTIEDRMLPGKIAYIQLNQVSGDAGALWQEVLAKYQALHPKGWILDLRNDPGGYVSQAVQIAQTMIPSGTIVTFKGQITHQVYSSSSGQSLSAPMVVLVNGGSASAAEILTGALMDYHKAVVIGTQTFGKGIAQELVPMQGGGVLKVTIADWYTPDGQNIEHVGIRPNLFVDGNNAPLVMAEKLLGDQTSLTTTLTVGSVGATQNGGPLTLDQAPVLKGGQLYVSLDTAAQALGVDPVPGANKADVTIRYGKGAIAMTAGSTSAVLNGQKENVPAPFFLDGLLMVPASPLVPLAGISETANGTHYTFVNSFSQPAIAAYTH